MSSSDRVRIPLHAALPLVTGYIKTIVLGQVRAVSFILIYLFAFQRIILKTPVSDGPGIALGVILVITGLSLFLEGIRLALMPLGEQVGLGLPARFRGITLIALFGFLIGFGATLAEPSVAALKRLGSTIPAWDAPLLYLILQRHTSKLILAIGAGVGIAVIFGLARFFYGFSIKPLIFTVIPLVLGATLWAQAGVKTASLIGLAWDSGAVTTGAVTVPLVLAIGIGVSRASSKQERTNGGFGVVMLASAFPILAVLILGAVLSPLSPDPKQEGEFFSPSNREEALRLFGTEEELNRYAFLQAGEAGRKAYYSDIEEYHSALRSLAADREFRQQLLGDIGLSGWIRDSASASEREILNSLFPVRDSAGPRRAAESPAFAGETVSALRAIIPLSLLLVLVLVVFLRDRPRYKDEIILGIILAVFGLAAFTTGMGTGLTPLGNELGTTLPQAFKAEERETDRIVIENFNPDIVFHSISPDGKGGAYFYLETDGQIERVRYNPVYYNRDENSYTHVITRRPLFSPDLTFLGIALVLLFAFGLGYGSSLAEPALRAMGKTVEILTVRSVKEERLVRVVAFGVGLGILMGVLKILFAVPIVWMLIPPYILLLPLTLLGEEQFVGIAWDSGGVTTGPVTVPLVLAMGLGIGGELGARDSFGILALGSAYPVFTVLAYGLLLNFRQHRSMRSGKEQTENE